jgi:hypothetical protein
MAPEDACSAEMLVLIRWHDRVMAVPLSQLTPVASDEATAEAIGDWHYLGGERLSFLSFQSDSPPLHTLTENSPMSFRQS